MNVDIPFFIHAMLGLAQSATAVASYWEKKHVWKYHWDSIGVQNCPNGFKSLCERYDREKKQPKARKIIACYVGIAMLLTIAGSRHVVQQYFGRITTKPHGVPGWHRYQWLTCWSLYIYWLPRGWTDIDVENHYYQSENNPKHGGSPPWAQETQPPCWNFPGWGYNHPGNAKGCKGSTLLDQACWGHTTDNFN